MTQARKEGKEAVGSLRSWAINCCIIRSYYVSVTSHPSSRSPSTGPPRTPILLRYFEPSSSSWHPNFSSPPTPPAPRKRQYMYAGLKKVRDTERSEHTVIHPAVPSPLPTPSSHDTWNNPNFEDLCSAKETYFCTAKSLISIFLVFRPIKSREKDIRKKHYIPCNFDGLDQQIFGIRNELFIKWCPGIINPELNVVLV